MRVALADRVEKFDADQLAALNGTPDDGLKVMLTDKKTRDFTGCITAKGWLAIPDVLLAP